MYCISHVRHVGTAVGAVRPPKHARGGVLHWCIMPGPDNATMVTTMITTMVPLSRWGTKKLQVRGFVFCGACFVLMAVVFKPFKHDHPDWLFAVYCLLTFSLSGGPNVSTFVLPSETFPAEVRSTFNGISAAMGKLGAVVGAYIFSPIYALVGIEALMLICAALSFIAAALTAFIVPDTGAGVTRASDDDSSDREAQSSCEGEAEDEE